MAGATLHEMMATKESAPIPSINALLRKADLSHQTWARFLAGGELSTKTVRAFAIALDVTPGDALNALIHYRKGRQDAASAAASGK